jgi:hypothetical protein
MNAEVHHVENPGSWISSDLANLPISNLSSRNDPTPIKRLLPPGPVLSRNHQPLRYPLNPASEQIAMSAPGGAPSPAPRSGSLGPGANGGGMPMSSQPPLSGTPVHQPSTQGQSSPMSQQNLNQIVSSILCRPGICTHRLRPHDRNIALYNVFALKMAMIPLLDPWRVHSLAGWELQ